MGGVSRQARASGNRVDQVVGQHSASHWTNPTAVRATRFHRAIAPLEQLVHERREDRIELAFPNNIDRPTLLLKRDPSGMVSGLVAAELVSPERLISRGALPTFAAIVAVPEAPMDEYGCACSC